MLAAVAKYGLRDETALGSISVSRSQVSFGKASSLLTLVLFGANLVEPIGRSYLRVRTAVPNLQGGVRVFYDLGHVRNLDVAVIVIVEGDDGGASELVLSGRNHRHPRGELTTRCSDHRCRRCRLRLYWRHCRHSKPCPAQRLRPCGSRAWSRRCCSSDSSAPALRCRSYRRRF